MRKFSYGAVFAVAISAPAVAGALSVPLAGVASADGDVSVSVNGTVRTQHGTSVANSTPTDPNTPGGANVAIARNDSTAFAGLGAGNKAYAANDSDAFAGLGSNNTATATNDSVATAGTGTNNTATATDDSFAEASNGDNNTATASDGSFADARLVLQP